MAGLTGLPGGGFCYSQHAFHSLCCQTRGIHPSARGTAGPSHSRAL